jgi:hypothetical protein
MNFCIHCKQEVSALVNQFAFPDGTHAHAKCVYVDEGRKLERESRRELDEVRAEVTRTAAVVQALAFISPEAIEKAKCESMKRYAVPYLIQATPGQDYYSERAKLIKLRARQAELEAAKEEHHV